MRCPTLIFSPDRATGFQIIFCDDSSETTALTYISDRYPAQNDYPEGDTFQT